jgi:polyferredoxin
MVQTAAAGGGLVWPNAAKMTILIAILVAMLFTLRPWCTLFCPLGAIFSLFNRVSVLVLRFRGAECKECGGCERMCRYGVLPAVDMNSVQCIRCLECTECDALTVGHVLHAPVIDMNRRHPPLEPPAQKNTSTDDPTAR